jgi:hypothetical protein
VKELGAKVNHTKENVTPSLFIAARQGHLEVVRWLLAEGFASVGDTLGPQRHTLWNLLKLEGAVDTELTSLLQQMVLLADAPADFIAKLSSQQAELWEWDRHLWTRLPAYQEQQRTLIVAHCPLPPVLRPLVAEYAAPTSEDIWTDELRVSSIVLGNSCP